MEIMKASVSDLEAFRLIGEEVINEEEAINQILRKDPPTEAIQRGRDLHSFIETGRPDGLALPWDINSLDAHIEIGDRNGEHEVWISGPLNGLYITARADLLCGYEIREFKATASQFSVDKYQASYQWRLYLALSGCNKVIYRVFEVSNTKPLKVFRAHTFGFYRYPAMLDDCRRLIEEYTAWASRFPEIVALQDDEAAMRAIYKAEIL